MTVTVSNRWVNPPNFDESPSAGDVGVHHAHVILNGTSDGTANLTDSQVVDISNIHTTKGVDASRIALVEVIWDIRGFDHITLKFDRTSNDTFLELVDVGARYYDPPLADTGSGSTGDVLMSTAGATATSAFSIELRFRVK